MDTIKKIIFIAILIYFFVGMTIIGLAWTAIEYVASFVWELIKYMDTFLKVHSIWLYLILAFIVTMKTIATYENVITRTIVIIVNLGLICAFYYFFAPYDHLGNQITIMPSWAGIVLSVVIIRVINSFVSSEKPIESH